MGILIPIYFCVPTLNCGPLVAKYLAENGVSAFFVENHKFNSFNTLHYLYGMSRLIPNHFYVPTLSLVPLVAKYVLENMVSRLFFKAISSINFIPGIQPYGVSLFTCVHVHVPTISCIPVLAKYLPEKGGSRILLPLWPSSGQNNAVIFSETKFSRRWHSDYKLGNSLLDISV